MVSRDQQYANAYLNGKAEYLFVWCMDQMIARHRMIISWVNNHGSVEDSIYMTTHEIGHVFGLLHEHQRDDRKFASSADELHVCETTNTMSNSNAKTSTATTSLPSYPNTPVYPLRSSATRQSGPSRTHGILSASTPLNTPCTPDGSRPTETRTASRTALDIPGRPR
jgi:hypothetical protein